MENRINIAELLKDCPRGMELDCILFNKPVKYGGINNDDVYSIIILINKDDYFYLTKEGYLYNIPNSNCVIFPKGKTTWEGFMPPCQFKAGDVIVSEYGNIVLFSHIDSKNTIHYHCIIPTYGSFRIEENTSVGVGMYYKCVLANEQQRKRMYYEIKRSGYEYNQSTNKLEKLIEPKFKVVDRIVKKK